MNNLTLFMFAWYFPSRLYLSAWNKIRILEKEVIPAKHTSNCVLKRSHCNTAGCFCE